MWGQVAELDYSEIFSSLTAMVPRGAAFELRLLGSRKGQIDAGYFDCPAQAATALVGAGGYYKGAYVTPNPVKSELMARSYNRITPWMQTTTHDPEIERRRWLLIDVDPKRPKGISSSDHEHERALFKARTIAGILSLEGFCDPLLGDSGNGAHLMYPMDEENTDQVRDEIQTFLQVLKVLFDDAENEVDTTVYNAARIWRVYGTWARKGDSTPDRPHRRSRVVQPADPFRRLSIAQVMRFNARYADRLPATVNGGTRQTGDSVFPPADESLFRRLNDYAYLALKLWVPHFFPAARDYQEGYRVESADLGEQWEEDLTLHPLPKGIKYFGIADQGDATQGRRTPVGVIAEYALKCDKMTAAKALSTLLNFPISELGSIAHLSAPAPASGGALVGTTPIEGLLGTKPKINFKGVRSIADLQKREFKQIKYVVEGVIPTGNILLAARPKMRKTWLALQMAIAIATGGKFLDWDCNKGDVLFLGLEDNERRIQNRIRTLQRFQIAPPDLSGFRYWTGGMDYNSSGQLVVSDPQQAEETFKTFPRGEAGADALEQFLEAFPLTSTIFIDTLAHFRGERSSRDVYQADYDAMMPLTKLAARKEVLIIPVTHEKKGNADRERGGDFLEDVTGSAGISGGADGVISIKGRRGVQDENESRKLLISGRDVPFDYEVDMAFDADRGGWLKAAREDLKLSIRTLLARHPFLNQKDIQNLLPNAGVARIYQCLTAMKLEGEIEQGKYGFALKR